MDKTILELVPSIKKNSKFVFKFQNGRIRGGAKLPSHKTRPFEDLSSIRKKIFWSKFRYTLIYAYNYFHAKPKLSQSHGQDIFMFSKLSQVTTKSSMLALASRNPEDRSKSPHSKTAPRSLSPPELHLRPQDLQNYNKLTRFGFIILCF